MDTQNPAGPGAGAPGPQPGHGPGPTAGAPYPGAGGPRPTGAQGFWAGVRRTGLYRTEDRWIGGVAGGVAARLNVDPLLVRGILAVTFLLGGLGLLLYGVAWALLPEQRDGRIHLEQLVAGAGDVALLGALGFVLVGLARGDGWWWFWDGTGWFSGLLWLAFVGGLVALVVLAVRRRGGPPRPGPWGAPGAPYGPTAYGPVPPAAPWGTPAAGPATGPATGPVTSPATGPATGAATGTASAAPYPATAQPTTPPAPAWGAGTAPYPPGPPAGWTPPPAGGWSAPPPPSGPPVPPRPARPPRPPRRGADAVTVGAVIGLAAIGLAALLVGERTGAFDGPVGLTAGGVALVLAGLGIVTLGARGRSSGALGFLAIVTALVWLPLALFTQGEREDWWSGPDDWRENRIEMTVTSRDDAARGIEVGVGEVTVDLTTVPMEDEPLSVPISFGAGDLTVVVPADTAVEARVSAGIGSVRWELDGRTRTQEGIGIGDMTFRDDATADAGEAELVLEISSGVGQVRIIEEDAA